MKNVVTHPIELSESSPSKKESNSPTKVNRQAALAKNAAGAEAAIGRSPNQFNVRKSVIGKLPGQVGSHVNLMSDVHNEKGVGK